MRKRPLIAIVGRPNVGKSTLFNRLIGERKAVVHEKPGMTRDRHYADGDYLGRPFTVIDTGGYEDSTDSTLLQQMRQQSIIAMEEADVVIFLSDVNEPDDPVDQEILEKLRASGRPFFLAINKCESDMRVAQAYADFSNYGVDVYPLSALHGEGVYDMMDELTEGFEQWDPDEEDEDSGIIKVAIVGRQNVGKSTLLNRLFGQERVIANEIGGTTRDAIDAEVTVDGQPFLLIDTAGIRRRGRIQRGPEKLSVHSSFRAIDRADVALLVLDINDGITAQDQHVAGYVLERKKACVIVLNKWDKIDNREQRYGELIRMVRHEFAFMAWAPILTVSALTGQRTHKIWDLIRHCAENYRKEFGTRELNLVLQKATAYVSPPTHKGNALKIKYVTQIYTKPPTLSFFVNDPSFLHYSYRRFLKNQFHKQLGLEGSPIVMRFRRKAPPRGWERGSRPVPSTQRSLEIERDRMGLGFYGGVYDDSSEEFLQEIPMDGMEFDGDFEEEEWEEDDEEREESED